MEEAVKLGLTRSIGVSNFNIEQLDRLIKNANIKPVVNQIEVPNLLTSLVSSNCFYPIIIVIKFVSMCVT